MTDDDEIISEENLHFYYNRDERVRRAPDIVRSHYDGSEKLPPKGFFKSLTHTKSSRFLLGSIVLLIIMILFATNIDLDSKSGTIDSIPFSLSAFKFEESAFVTVKADETIVQDDIPVSVYFYALDSENTIVEQSSIHSIFDGKENFYRTTFSKYDIMFIECEVLLNGKTLELKTNVQE